MRVSNRITYKAAALFAGLMVLTIYTDAQAAEWKVIAGDGSYSTSDCIGSNATLECLIDTLAACSAGVDLGEYRTDGRYREPNVCFDHNARMGLGIFYEEAPVRTRLHYYTVDIWPLERVDDWGLDAGDHNDVAIGDVVVDYYATTCLPDKKVSDPACFQPLEPGRDAPFCPPTYCYSKFDLTCTLNETGVEVAVGPWPEELVLSRLPTQSVVMRNTNEGWLPVDWYMPHLIIWREPDWVAQRWRDACTTAADFNPSYDEGAFDTVPDKATEPPE